MLQAYTQTPQFSDAKNQKDITEQLDEDCMHSSVLITCPLKRKRSQRTLSMRAAATEAETNPSTQPATMSNSKPTTSSYTENGEGLYSTCTALYDYQAKSRDELCLRKGDVIIIQEKEADGWWYGSLNGKEGIFPATYVAEENPPSMDKTLSIDEETSF
ncbi:hypothetical protein lerEdw1_017410 [Lerista edwardsae]|nr:hypothetical protein lerEdw1_017410 [Lerista edwardsae]